jgi:hypothetical protein
MLSVRKELKNAILFGIYVNELHSTDLNELDYVSWLESRLERYNEEYKRLYPMEVIKNPKRKITITNRHINMAFNELPTKIMNKGVKYVDKIKSKLK